MVKSGRLGEIAGGRPAAAPALGVQRSRVVGDNTRRWNVPNSRVIWIGGVQGRVMRESTSGDSLLSDLGSGTHF